MSLLKTDQTNKDPLTADEPSDEVANEDKPQELAKGVEVSMNNISSKLKFMLPFYKHL